MSENSRGKRLAKNTIIYMVSNFGSKVLTFLIVPLYSWYLTTSQYGTYDTIVSVEGLIMPLCILAINEGLLRWLLKSDERDGAIVGTGYGIYLVLLILSDAVLAVAFAITGWHWGRMFLFLLTVSTMYTVLQYTARGAKQNRAFAVSGVLYTVTMLSCNLIFIVGMHYKIGGMLMSLALAYLAGALYLLAELRNLFRPSTLSFDKKLGREMLRYSIMLVPNNISWWIMNASDRIMLTAMIGSSYTGIYSIACKFPTIVSTIHTIFYQAWQEQAVIEYDSDTRDQFYTRVFNVYVRLAGSLVLVLVPFSKLFIALFMNESYVEGYRYTGVLYLGALFSSFSAFYGTGYISSKDTKSAMYTTFLGAAINALINLLFIRKFGIWAACYSTFFGYLAVWVVRMIQTRKYFTITVEWKTFFLLMGSCAVISAVVCFCGMALTWVLFAVTFAAAFLLNKKLIRAAVRFLKNRRAKA
jgi:O-antigen/teichoic acid export membrane protein